MKGRTSFMELASMPGNILQTLYFKAWKDSFERAKEDEVKKKKGDNTPSISDTDIEDALEELN